MKDIQVFLSFANFYRRFIQNLNKIAGPPTSMLKTTRLAKNLSLLLMVEDAEVDSKSGDCEDETAKWSLSKNSNGAMGYLTPNARQVFTQLR